MTSLKSPETVHFHEDYHTAFYRIYPCCTSCFALIYKETDIQIDTRGKHMKKEALLELVTVYRQDLHRIPELDFDLNETGEYIKSKLKDLRCEITEVAKTGICVFFDFGEKETTAFRSDMDALPITETTGAEYASNNEGRMHACGHDGHMAMLLGFAQILDEYKNEDPPRLFRRRRFDPLTNALLIFQPAEETTGGARYICEEGVLEKYNVKRIFGFHLWPYIDKSVIATRSGPMMAKSSEINVEIEGRTSHCTAYEEGIDALHIGCQFINKVYNMPEVLPEAPSILKFGKMESGDVRNAISSHTRIEGTLRCLDIETFDLIIAKMNEIADIYNDAYSCSIYVTHTKGYPPVTNNYRLFSKASSIFSDLGFRELEKPSMIADDFAFYKQ